MFTTIILPKRGHNNIESNYKVRFLINNTLFKTFDQLNVDCLPTDFLKLSLALRVKVVYK